MNIKPILFNTEMIRAILDGRKTQTRRVVKLKYSNTSLEIRKDKYGTRLVEAEIMTEGHRVKKPDGTTTLKLRAIEDKIPPYKRGDILWVRETWNGDWCEHYIYKADSGSAVAAGYSKEPSWRPSIHMPREAARIFLKVNDVHVERLWDMNEETAIAEGFEDSSAGTDSPLQRFSELWDKTINRDDLREFGYHANPLVWMIEFERCGKPEGWYQNE